MQSSNTGHGNLAIESLFNEFEGVNSTGSSFDKETLFPDIIGRSPSIIKTLEIVNKVARSDSAAFIFGESGTGKELIASALHRLSARSSSRFVAINCSAIPDNLLESELFGHERGAFTGASSRRVGHFEQANGGTIFLDEVGDMPMRLQSKLLRVLQERQFSAIGSSRVQQVDVRVIAATNVDLEQAVSDQKFRLDLYYRLNVLPIQMPSLKERMSDYVLLMEHFLNQCNRKNPERTACYFSPEMYKILEHYTWPGNIRELQNLVERLFVISDGGVIGPHHLPSNYITTPRAGAELAAGSEPVSFSLSETTEASFPEKASKIDGHEFGLLPADGVNMTEWIENLENSLILQALDRTRNNKNQAAKLLGLNRTTLVERIKKRKLVPLNSPSKEL